MHKSWKNASRELLLEELEFQAEARKALEEIKEHYRLSLIRIRDQKASPNFGTPEYNDWLHWRVIAEKALDDIEG